MNSAENFVHSFELSDGRKLCYYDSKTASQDVVLFFHGFPGGYRQGLLALTSPHAKKFRFISMDRPGLGDSDLNPKGNLLSFAKDIEELLQSLKISRVRLLGISGGAPYAMACAFHLKDSVQRVSLVCPLGPLGNPEVFSAMPESSQSLFRFYRKSRFLGNVVLRIFRQYFLKSPKRAFLKLASRYPDVDRQALEPEKYSRDLIASFESAFSQGVGGLLKDVDSYLSPWPFSIAAIECPFDIWHGDADTVVPVQVGQWYSKNLRSVTMTVKEKEGHFSLPIRFMDEFLEALLEV
jgi:pimeloyl-ACP methyl ester carboxylesterase